MVFYGKNGKHTISVILYSITTQFILQSHQIMLCGLVWCEWLSVQGLGVFLECVQTITSCIQFRFYCLHNIEPIYLETRYCILRKNPLPVVSLV